MKFCALASGSSGNCFFVKNKDSGILIDVGISAKRVVEGLAGINENPENIKGIFITHEHSDHIKGVDVLARNFGIPIYATSGTINNCFLCSQGDLINPIKSDETVRVSGMEVEAFAKSHKAGEPVSYRIRNGKIISVITDIGKACKNVQEAVSDSDFLAIESNHDEEMLISGPYPAFLKKWILSDIGHISNLNSACCVLEHGKAKLKNVLLSHLSKTNNTPELAYKVFHNLVKERSDLKPKISLSLRDVASDVFRVGV